MPRKLIPLNPSDPYQISARCLNREWFNLPLASVWSVMEDYLFLTSSLYGLRLHSFVLMSNHFHLLLTAPNANLSEALLYFMRETSREITRLSGRINQTYGIRNHKTRISNYHYFMNTYKYVYQNPIRAGICKRAEDYPYSTLNGLCGLSRLLIPLAEDTILFSPEFDESALRWINAPPEPSLQEEMRLALRRTDLIFKTSRKTGRESKLKEILL